MKMKLLRMLRNKSFGFSYHILLAYIICNIIGIATSELVVSDWA